jgi:hypothetical protein
MNILLWILQAALAFLYVSGGAYKATKFEELSKQLDEIPHAGWRALGVLEILGAILLIVPAVTQWMPELTPLAATVLALETLAIALLSARHSLKLTAQNPMVWALGIGLSSAFVAYGRYALSPLSG